MGQVCCLCGAWTLFNAQLSVSSINFKHDRAAGYSSVSIMGRIYSKLGPVNINEPAFMSTYFVEGGVVYHEVLHHESSIDLY